MTFGPDAPLLGNLALEPMRLGAGRCERRITVGDPGRTQRQLPLGVAGEHHEEAQAIGTGRLAEQARNARAVFDGLQNVFPKISVIRAGNFRKRGGAAVPQKNWSAGFHEAPPSVEAI